MNATRSTAIAAAAIVALFVTIAIIFDRSGLLRAGGPKGAVTVLPAVLGLVGTLVASVLGLVGVMLTDTRLRIEKERNDALQRDAEARLKLDVAIRAVQLLATDPASPQIQRSGALFALVSLGSTTSPSPWPVTCCGTTSSIRPRPRVSSTRSCATAARCRSAAP